MLGENRGKKQNLSIKNLTKDILSTHLKEEKHKN